MCRQRGRQHAPAHVADGSRWRPSTRRDQGRGRSGAWWRHPPRRGGGQSCVRAWRSRTDSGPPGASRGRRVVVEALQPGRRWRQLSHHERQRLLPSRSPASASSASRNEHAVSTSSTRAATSSSTCLVRIASCLTGVVPGAEIAAWCRRPGAAGLPSAPAALAVNSVAMPAYGGLLWTMKCWSGCLLRRRLLLGARARRFSLARRPDRHLGLLPSSTIVRFVDKGGPPCRRRPVEVARGGRRWPRSRRWKSSTS